MTKPTDVYPSSGNVFADLSIPNPEQYLAKAELAAQILKIVRRRCLTQMATGELLGINQPKVSALLNGTFSMGSPQSDYFASSMPWVVTCGSVFRGPIPEHLDRSKLPPIEYRERLSYGK